MDQQERPLTDAEQALRQLQAQPQLPQPLSEGMLNERQRQRSRALSSASTGSDHGILPDFAQMMNISQSLYNYIFGLQDDLQQNQEREQTINNDRDLRQRARDQWTIILRRLLGRDAYNDMMNEINESVQLHRIHQRYLNDWENEFVRMMTNVNQQDPILRIRLRNRLIDFLRDFYHDFREEQDRQQHATLQGGAIPRPHMFMQSEESRAISNYFHNKLRRDGNK